MQMLNLRAIAQSKKKMPPFSTMKKKRLFERPGGPRQNHCILLKEHLVQALLQVLQLMHFGESSNTQPRANNIIPAKLSKVDMIIIVGYWSTTSACAATIPVSSIKSVFIRLVFLIEDYGANKSYEQGRGRSYLLVDKARHPGNRCFDRADIIVKISRCILYKTYQSHQLIR